MKIKEVLKKSVALALMTIMVAATPANINAASWQQNNTGWWWLEDDGSYPASTWKSINGKWYYFNSYGYMLGEGWHWINGKCYYMYSGGDMAANTWVDGSYVDASGAWVPGAQPAQWMITNGRWWYLNEDGSYPANEWKAINGKWYYFDAEGWMLDKGWHWIDGKCYYMYAGGANASDTWIGENYVDVSGAWVEGKYKEQWLEYNNRWWYQYEDGSCPADEWAAINGKWYYFDAEGWMLDKGWHWINGKCYYMYNGGANASDIWIDGYYVNVSGEWVPPKDQWISSGKRWWYKHGDGSYTRNGWEYIQGAWYYFDAEGWMLDEGWHWIGDNCYYMYAGGEMAADTWIGDSYVDASGAWVPEKCNHKWDEKYGNVEHPEEGHTEKVFISPEEGHYENVLVKEQWTEYKLIKEAIYENQWIVDKEAWEEKVHNPAKDKYEIHYLCNGCKKDFGQGDEGYNAVDAHVEEQMLNGNFACGGWHEAEVLVEKGYDIIPHPEEGHYEEVKIADAVYESIWHPAEYEEKWIVDKEAVYEEKWIIDKEAWSEYKFIGYVCSKCGELVPEECEHKWEKKYVDIKHPEEGRIEKILISPEEGHYENVLVKEQWTEYKLIKEAIYENQWIVDKEAWEEKVHNPAKDKYEIHYLCNGCKKDFGQGDEGYNAVDAHVEEQMLNGNFACGGWHEAEVLVEKGYDIIPHPEEGHYEEVKIADAVYESIWHPAEYEEKWIVDKEAEYEEKWHLDQEAWTEHKLVGCVCSHCGESKEAEETIEE